MVTEVKLKIKDAEFIKERRAVAKINSSICINCGTCRRVCPMDTIDEYQRDICRLCPDCTPKDKMFMDESKAFAPEHACSLQCPLGTIPEGYVNLIAQEKFAEAYELISELNPLPSICSMICHHPCESDCKRGLLIDEPIAIRALKRFVTENVTPAPLKFTQKFDKKIAIVGGGPAGITAAADLAAKGYKVTIFEAGSKLGGMAMRAVPSFRLDKKKLEEEIQRIIDAGVEVKYGMIVGIKPSVTDLLNDHYAAVILTVGASKGVILPIEGNNAERVYDALALMKNINGKQITKGTNEPGRRYSVGKKTVVIGGGSVALDTARSLKRLGSDVICACLESGVAVPAPEWERAELKEEGIELIEGVSPKRIITEFFTVKGIEFLKVDKLDKDESGKMLISTIEGSEFTIDCDSVVFAVGQKADIRDIAAGAGIETAKGRIVFDKETLATSDERVFVAGDLVEARGSVVSAMASGRKAALSVDNLLQKRTLKDPAEKVKPQLAPNSEKIFPAMLLERIDPQDAPKLRHRDTFELVEGVFDAETAVIEARRCMKCGYSGVNADQCIGCGTCVNACPVNAITLVNE